MDVATKAAALLGEALRSSERLHGGDLAEVARVVLRSGRTVVTKSGELVRVEADMLRAMARAGVPVPSVIAVGNDVLVMEDLGDSDAHSGSWRDLGSVLRQLHCVEGETYGWKEGYRFSSVEVPNEPAGSWPAFWAERRLLSGAEFLPAEFARRVEVLSKRVDHLLPSRPQPSLLHGDLWTGNIMSRGHRITGLIDPACYYGHSEVDLAMLTLFGSLSQDFWASYGATDAGVDERRSVYQLWPALVHVRLFGSSYFGLVDRLLRATE